MGCRENDLGGNRVMIVKSGRSALALSETASAIWRPNMETSTSLRRTVIDMIFRLYGSCD